jgi:hypothetical protein
MVQYLGIVGCGTYPKPRWDNLVLDALSQKEEFQVEKPSTKIQALRANFQGKSSHKQKIREAYMQEFFVQ